jgi:hypothetical protein
MHSIQSQIDQEKLLTENRLRFLSVVRVKLQILQFSWSDWRDLDKKKMKWLKNIFKEFECDRLNSQNYVSVSINEKKLRIVVEQSSNVQQKTLLSKNVTLVKLIFSIDYRLTCLHDFHRILVEREFLRSWNKWWVVKLFSINKVINEIFWIIANCKSY